MHTMYAFTPPLILPHGSISRNMSACRPIKMGLRNNSRPYNSSFSRSNRKPYVPPAASSNGSESSSEMQSPASIKGNGAPEPLLDSQDPPKPPSSSGNGHWREDGEGGDSSHEGIAALLAASNRTLSSLPAEAARATPKQLARLLEIEKNALLSLLCRFWPALRARLVANERLPIQMGVELTVGFICKTLAEIQGRGERFRKELDFYYSNLALELVADAMLVWLLCPVATFGAVRGGWMSKLPRHFAQIGDFGNVQRGVAFLYKGVQFGIVGFLSSVVGHGVTVKLVENRREEQRKRGEVVEDSDMGGVLHKSTVWGAYMMTSSNVRYQLVNAMEQRVLEKWLGQNVGLLTGGSFVLRFGNCLLGGVQWLPFARFWGIQ